MSTFTLPNTEPAVEVTLPADLTKDQLLNFTAFKNWLSSLQHSLSLQEREDHSFHSDPFRLRRIDVQSVDWFGKPGTKLGFVKIQADVSNSEGGLPGAVFLRGGSVGMLIIIQPEDAPAGTETDKFVIMTVQPRIAAGSLALAELPAGMIDDGTFSGKAAGEIKEEVGLDIPEDQLLNMSEVALSDSDTTTLWRKPGPNINPGDAFKEQLQNAMYPSPGACDEFIPLFLHQKRMPRADLEELSGKLTGLREEGERITLKLVRLEDLWKEGARDAKALAALSLYEGLRKQGKI